MYFCKNFKKMKGFAFFVATLLFSSVFLSCVKYESVIQGKVTYIAYYDDMEYVAKGAILQKVKIQDTNETIISGVLSDSLGHFLFDYVTAGDWIIKAKLFTEDAVYEGKSAIIHTTGEDKKDIKMVLVFKEMITNE